MSDVLGQPAAQFVDLPQQRAAAVMGMWVFLATEVLFFGGLFVAYYLYRDTAAEDFAHGARHLKLALGTGNTAVLLTSSLTMTLASQAELGGQRRACLSFLGATALLGTIFLIVKGFEYAAEYREGLMPFGNGGFQLERPGNEKLTLFFHFYFVMTGLHAVHLLIGIGAVLVLTASVLLGRAPTGTPLVVTGLYWHFIDVVWVFLFSSLYLVGRYG